MLLGALLSGDWDTADASEARERREASGLIAAFLQWHVERGLRSLPLVERGTRTAVARVDEEGRTPNEVDPAGWSHGSS